MQPDLMTIIERSGSLGLLGWLLIWATGTAWPKVSAHLDAVSEKLERIAGKLEDLRADIAELKVVAGRAPARHPAVVVGPALAGSVAKPTRAGAGPAPTRSAV